MAIKASAVAAGVVVLAAAAATAWWFRDSAPVRGLAQQAQEATGKLGSVGGAGGGNKAGGLHKCLQGSQVLYTDGPCPAGSRTQAVAEGNITVVQGTRAPAPAASVPNVRDLLAPKEEVSMRDKMMERAIDNIGK